MNYLPNPSDKVLKHTQGTLNYQAWSTSIVMLQRQIIQGGIVPGDTVGLLISQDWRIPLVLFACWGLKICVLPLNPKLPHLSAVLDRAGCHWLIGDEDRSEGAVRYLSLEQVFTSLSVVDFSAKLPRETWQPPPDEQPVTLILTSGSTHEPKLAELTWGNYVANAMGALKNIQFSYGDQWLLSLPLYHVGGLSILIRAFVAGAGVVMISPLEEGLKSPELTHISMVSTQLVRALESPELVARLKTLKAILLGGGPFSPSLIEKAYSCGLPIHLSYGSTEMASQITCTPPQSSLEVLLGAGKVLPGRELSFSEEGEIKVKGPCLFQGYRHKQTLNLPLDEQGWFLTRDRGCLDEKGYLKVLGRMDAMFISGGENIQPEEIEAHLMDLSGLELACVVPVPDEEFGQRPVAFVRARRLWKQSELQAELRRQLPSYKVPVAFFEWPELPQDGLKFKRSEMQALAVMKISQKNLQ